MAVISAQVAAISAQVAVISAQAKQQERKKVLDGLERGERRRQKDCQQAVIFFFFFLLCNLFFHNLGWFFFFLFFSPFIFISWRLITLQYRSGFCHTSTWISHGFTCVPHPDPPSHLPLHPVFPVHQALALVSCIQRQWSFIIKHKPHQHLLLFCESTAFNSFTPPPGAPLDFACASLLSLSLVRHPPLPCPTPTLFPLRSNRDHLFPLPGLTFMAVTYWLKIF